MSGLLTDKLLIRVSAPLTTGLLDAVPRCLPVSLYGLHHMWQLSKCIVFALLQLQLQLLQFTQLAKVFVEVIVNYVDMSFFSLAFDCNAF